MHTRTIWQALMLPPWRFLASRWPWLGLAYALSSAVLGAALLGLVVVTVLLLPLWGILSAAVERRRIRILGGEAPATGHVVVPPEERHNWLNIRLTEPATWRETVALLAGILFGWISLAVLFAQGLALAVLVMIPVMARVRPSDLALFGDARVVLGPDNWWVMLPLIPITLALFAYLNATLAALQGSCVRWLIAPRSGEIDQRVARLTRSRAAIVDAHERERRRIERDLHDGVQQELVAVAVRLALLELELDNGDDASRRRALEATQLQTERALESLRTTVRGIHPAVLADHGLAAALIELSGRSVIPLRIEDRGFPRLAPAAEAAGYFCVAEALSNAAKHTAAPRLTVTLTRDATHARVEARDEGHGGVELGRGSGLRGLAERADALDGTLSVQSPTGGPTILTLTLPVTATGPGADPGVDPGVDPGQDPWVAPGQDADVDPGVDPASLDTEERRAHPAR